MAISEVQKKPKSMINSKEAIKDKDGQSSHKNPMIWNEK